MNPRLQTVHLGTDTTSNAVQKLPKRLHLWQDET